MSNGTEMIDVSAYDRITDVLAFVQHMGRQIALSGMFGVDKVAQGEIIAMECLARKTPLLTLAQRYHFIFGRLTMKAEVMLADFRQRFGGEYEIVERTSDAAEISTTYKGKTQRFRFTWEEAQKEPFIYVGKEDEIVAVLASKKTPKLKAKYATPRSRMQMLWARVVSDSIGRCVCPEVVGGAYTPEEIEDFDELQEQVESRSKAANGNGKNPESVVESVVVTPVSTPTVATPQPQPTTPAPQSTPETLCDAADVDRIMQLCEVIQPTKEEMDVILAKRGVSNWRQLSKVQAVTLINKLQEIAAQIAADAKASKAAQSVSNNDPATDEQVKQIKSLASEIEQSQPGFSAKLVEKIRSSGLSKLADLTVSEADSLIGQLGLKNVQAFIDGTLTGHAKFKAQAQASANPTSPPKAA